jgi:hypothetical protein
VEPVEPPSAGSTHRPSIDRPTNRLSLNRLEGLRRAGVIRRASERADTGVERSLPVGVALRHLLPGGCLRRGSTVAVTGSPPQTSLLFALLAEASAAGSWCAAVGLPQLGLVAAGEAGVALERLALIPFPGPEWTGVVAALIDGFDIVVAGTPTGVPAGLASRLTARARQRGAVLVPLGQWPGADVTLAVTHSAWQGLGPGRGRLRSREVEVVVQGRGAAARPRRARLWLPSQSGTAAPMPPRLVPLPAVPAAVPVSASVPPSIPAAIELPQRRAS